MKKFILVCIFLLGASLSCYLYGQVAGRTTDEFRVSENGAAAYQVPIMISPGTRGLVPKLSFVYGSQQGDGHLGIGWALGGMSLITRAPATIAQDNLVDGVDFDSDDRFTLDGERLIHISGSYGASHTEYRTEQESYTKIVSYDLAGQGPQRFKVWTKDGMIREYGYTADARVEAQGRADVMLWRLNKVTDRQGNYYTITYGEIHGNTESYPTRIDYTGNAGLGLTPYASVRFEYETRTDQVAQYVSGSKVAVSKRLKSVKAYYQGLLMRIYNLSYSYVGTGSRSYLQSIRECGANGTCKEAIQFDWSTRTEGFATPSFELASFGAHAGGWNSNHPRMLADVNGDGKADIVGFAGAGVYVSHSYGTGFNGATLEVSGTFGYNAGWRVDRHPRFLSDVNGDGKADIVGCANDGVYVSYATATGFAPAVREIISVFGYNAGWRVDRHPRFMVDVNGDKRADMVGCANDGLYVSYATGSGFTAPVKKLNAFGYDGAAGGWRVDRHPRLMADVNGDGMADMVGFANDGVVVAYSTGNGFTAPVLQLANYGYNAGGWRVGTHPRMLADVNGDGMADIVGFASNGVKVSFSTGTDFNNAQHMISYFGSQAGSWHHASHPRYVVDVNGDGRADIVGCANIGVQVSYSQGDSFAPSVHTISSFGYGSSAGGWNISNNPRTLADVDGDGNNDFIGFANAGVQVSFNNPNSDTRKIVKITNMRKEIHLTYDYLTNASLYTKYNLETYPKMEFQGAMQVISRVQTSNGVGGLTNVTYTYEGAHVDLEGRGFRGFKKITAANYTTGLKEITEFERDHRCVNSKIKKSEQRLISNNVMVSQVVNTITYQTTFGGHVNRSWVSHSARRSYKLTGGLVTTTLTDYSFDNYGNLTQETITYQGGHTKTVDRYYYNNPTTWILGQLTSERTIRTRSGQPTLARQIDYSYNAARTLMIRETIEPLISSLRVTKDYVYDGYGNIIRSTIEGDNGSGLETRVKQFVYDAKGRFQTRKINELGHTRDDAYDERFGNVILSTGPNGIQTTYTYDAFGRKLTQSTPGGGDKHYAYVYLGSGNETYYIEETTEGRPSMRTYYDVSGRETRNMKQGFNGTWIYQTYIYDSQGRLWKMSEPFYTSSPILYTVYEYDALHRMTRETAPGNRVRTMSYNGLTQTTTNPNGQQLVETRDALGNLVSTLNHLGHYTYQFYDSFDNLIEIRDGKGTQTHMQYDVLGRKIQIQDPNAGTISYTYNAFNEMLTEINARNQTTTFSYDKLGRMTQRVEPEGTTTWTYDIGNKAKSRLYQVTGPSGYQETYSYDSYSRLYKTRYTGPGGTFNIQTSYDNYGRPLQVTYPTNFQTQNHYDVAGYLYEVRNANNNAKFWTLEAMTPRDQWARARAGNNKVTNYTYDNDRGVVTRIYTQGVQDLHFTFDKVGNLTQRRDAARNLTEDFLYDGLNRLISTHAGTAGSTTITYDESGNITYRSDAGCYEYGGTGPQAVTRLKDDAGGTLKTFSYDASGNMTQNHNAKIKYTSYNKPYEFQEGRERIEIDYGPGRSRQTQRVYKSNSLQKTIRYVGSIYEQHKIGGTTRKIHYIMAGNKAVAIHTKTEQASHDDQPIKVAVGGQVGAVSIPGEVQPIVLTQTLYLHRDHIGSIQTITNGAGSVTEVLSYNAWGQRRNPYTWQAKSSVVASFARGFTGHEHLDLERFIHMGARVYDASIGRFLSADPFVSFEGTGQSLNRYSYVMNNPLSLVDPSGFFFKKLFKSLKRIVKSILQNPIAFIVGVVAAVLTFGVVNPLLTGALGGSFWGGLGAAVLSGAAAGAAGSFGATLVATGDLGMAAKAGLMGGLTGALSGGLMYGIDQILPTWMQTSSIARPNNPLSTSQRIAIQMGRSLTTSAVNGLSNKLRGGEFSDGFSVSLFGDMIRWGRDAFVEWRAIKQFRKTGWPGNQADQAQFLEDAGGTLRPSEGWESDNKTYGSQHVSVVNPRNPNVGIPKNGKFWNSYLVGENSAFMKTVSKIPGMNSMSIAHDYFADWAGALNMDLLTSQSTIPIFMGIEYSALLSEPHLYYIRGN
ncbi:MAG: FG-GAP-like repeat-containing protein [Bacteroidota bacterium]